MDTPPPPSVPPHVPLTPLGARTPHTHPALYGVIAVLSVVIIAGAAWLLWPNSAVGPAATPTPLASSSVVVTGGSQYVVYTNQSYGLRISLPDSWLGFRVISEEGEGSAWHGVDPATAMEIEGGPMIVLRHPQWTEAAPRQDIPLMVFTHEQWGHVIDGDWSLGAAPIPPTVLARNSTYVFALPARYNYAFPAGWEEVDALLQSGAVTAFQIEPMGLVKRAILDDVVFYDGWTSVSGRFSISNPGFNEFGSSDAISFLVDDATASRIPRVPGNVRDAWFRIRNDAEARTMLGIKPALFENPSCVWQAGTASIEITGYTEDLRPGETTDGAVLIRVLHAQPPVCTGS